MQMQIGVNCSHSPRLLTQGPDRENRYYNHQTIDRFFPSNQFCCCDWQSKMNAFYVLISIPNISDFAEFERCAITSQHCECTKQNKTKTIRPSLRWCLYFVLCCSSCFCRLEKRSITEKIRIWKLREWITHFQRTSLRTHPFVHRVQRCCWRSRHVMSHDQKLQWRSTTFHSQASLSGSGSLVFSCKRIKKLTQILFAK